MEKVQIIPKTKHMKNRVSQHGSVWHVISDEADRLLVRSLNETFRAPNGSMEHDLRWIRKDECNRL